MKQELLNYIDSRLRHVEPEVCEYIDQLELYLAAVLPMAKGYAKENPVGNNHQKISEAEQLLQPTLNPTAPRGEE